MKVHILMGLACATSVFAMPSKQVIQSHVEEYMEQLNVPSIAISVSTDKSVIFQKAFGYRDIENKIPATTKTIYPAGSISKSITAALIGIYCERGFLDYNDKIKNYIPYFELQDLHTTNHITIKDYLTHRSGYSSHDAIWVNTRMSRQALVEKLRYIPPKYELRDRFKYQNIGYSVAAYALESLLEKDYESLVQDTIFKQAGMKSACFDIKKMQATKNFAYGYTSFGENFVKVPFIDAYTIAPSGGMCCNIEDLTKWTQILQNKGGDIFSLQTHQTLTSPHILSNLISDPAIGLQKYVNTEAYGYGFFNVQYRGKQLIFHGGNIEGHSALMMYSPEDNIGISILTNKDRSLSPYLIAISLMEKLTNLPEIDWMEKYRELLKLEQNAIVNGRNNIDEKEESTTPTLDMESYKGKYIHKGYGNCSVEEKDGILMFTYNNFSIPLDHLHYNTFITSKKCPVMLWQNMKFHFRQSYNGEISSVATMFNAVDGPIVFKKRKSDFFLSTKYLKRFCGKYTYSGFTFTIEPGINCITLKAFGQPPYHLIGEKNLIFSIFSEDDAYKDYQVIFHEDENEDVMSVMLIKPDGVTYKANRISQ